MDILVFKTNVSSPREKQGLAPLLAELEGIRRWNLDLQDADCVLRIEAMNTPAARVEQQLRGAGHFCQELPD